MFANPAKRRRLSGLARPNGTFKPPQSLAELTNGQPTPATKQYHSTPTPVRQVFYPPPRAVTDEKASGRQVVYPACKRSPVQRVQVSADEYDHSEKTIAEMMATAVDPGKVEVEDTPAPPVAIQSQPPAAEVLPAVGVPDVNKGEDNSSDQQPPKVVKRLPPSEYGRLYFRVAIDGKGTEEGDDGNGLLVVSLQDQSCCLYDHKGRVSGKPKLLKEEHLDACAVGYTLKYGNRPIVLVEAIPEEEFFSGSVFLHKPSTDADHPHQVTEKTMTQGHTNGIVIPSGFVKPVFRRKFRSGSGLVVRKLGDPRPEKSKAPKEEPRALFDDSHPDAVVLFKAEYKPYISVVVDPHIGSKLRPHQKAGVQFMYDCVTGERVKGHYGCILADDMGLGKSIQAIAILWTLLKQGKYGKPLVQKALIVAPSSLVRNWCNELNKWLGTQVSPLAIAESTEKGESILNKFEMGNTHNVLVISYDQLRKYVERLNSIASIELVICDEGHRLKNAEIKTTKAVSSLPAKRRILLSGTPIQNDLGEFHAMVNFVNPGVIGDAATFRAVFEQPILAGREPQNEDDKVLGSERAHYLSKLTGKFILRRTAVINEKYLPAKVEATVFCRMTELQTAIYKSLLQGVKISEACKAQALATITTLKKLTNHPDLIYDYLHERKAEHSLAVASFPPSYRLGSLLGEASGKVRVLDGLIQAMQLVKHPSGLKDKMVVVSNYTQTLDVLAALCRMRRWGFFQLDGNTPIKKRQDLVDMFNVPNSREIVFLLSSKAGGVGLNLIGANRLVLYDPDWNPANDAQAMARVWREGQKKKVFIYRFLTTGSIEEKIYQRQVNKQGLSTTVVDCNQDAKQHFSTAELQALFVLKENTNCDTHDLLKCKTCSPSGPEMKSDPCSKLRKEFQVRQAGPRMDELKSWMHFPSAQAAHIDPVLGMADKDGYVSFVFANERDAQKVTEGAIQEEMPFQGDTKAIHVEAEEKEGDGLLDTESDDDDDDDDGSEEECCE